MEYRLGSVNQIPLGEGRNFAVGGVEVAVFRSRSGVFASQAACPHRTGPLADGLLGGTTLICPLHGWKFNLSTGEPLLGECGIRTYPLTVTESGELVLVLEPELTAV